MGASALARAARRQGQRGLLAWRAELAEAPTVPQLQCGEQQQGQPLDVATGAGAAQQQWPCGARLMHSGAGPSRSIVAAAAAAASSAPLTAAAGAGLAAASVAAPLWARQQRRGMALNFARYQKKRAPQEERTLPEKNEEIRAKEVRVLLRS